MRNLISVMCLFIFFSSCQTKRIYEKFENNSNVDLMGKVVFRKILNKIGDGIDQSSHLIYIYHATNHLPKAGTKDFHALIYDYSSKKKFLFQNESLTSYEITSSVNVEDALNLNFILKHYLDGKIGYLKSIQNKGISEGGLGTTYIYDIDLNTRKTDKFELESIILDKKGNPTTFEKYMNQN